MRCSLAPRENPGVPASTRKSAMPSRPRCRSVVATTTATSQTCAAVMKRLVPLRTQPSPAGRAEVWTPATSEPVPGSVCAMTQIFSPRTSAGRYARRCASVPLWSSMSVISLTRSWESATAAEARASSSCTTAHVSVSAPAPPCSGGTVIPRSPRSPIRR